MTEIDITRNGRVDRLETIATFANHVSSGKAAVFQSAGSDLFLGRRITGKPDGR